MRHGKNRGGGAVKHISGYVIEHDGICARVTAQAEGIPGHEEGQHKRNDRRNHVNPVFTEA